MGSSEAGIAVGGVKGPAEGGSSFGSTFGEGPLGAIAYEGVFCSQVLSETFVIGTVPELKGSDVAYEIGEVVGVALKLFVQPAGG